MEEFVRRQNLFLLRRRLDDSRLTEAERKVIRRLLAEQQAKKPAPRGYRANNDAATSVHGCRSRTPVGVDTGADPLKWLSADSVNQLDMSPEGPKDAGSSHSKVSREGERVSQPGPQSPRRIADLNI